MNCDILIQGLHLYNVSKYYVRFFFIRKKENRVNILLKKEEKYLFRINFFILFTIIIQINS